MSAELGRRRRPVKVKAEGDVHSEGEGEDIFEDEGDVVEEDAESAAEEEPANEEKSNNLEENEPNDQQENFADAPTDNTPAESVGVESASVVEPHENTVQASAAASEHPHRPLNKEDRKNPTFVPRSGQFYLHDTRGADDEPLAALVAAEEKKEPKENEGENTIDQTVTSSGDADSLRKNWKKSEKDLWDHDMYSEKEQAPLSTDEIIRKYGYDIRAYPADAPPPPRSERNNNRGYGNNRQRGSGKPGSGDRRRDRGGNDGFFQPKQNLPQHQPPQRRGPPLQPPPTSSLTKTITNDRYGQRSNYENNGNGGNNGGYRVRNDRQGFDSDFPPLPKGTTIAAAGSDQNHGGGFSRSREFVRTDAGAPQSRNRPRIHQYQTQHDLPPPLFGEHNERSQGRDRRDVDSAPRDHREFDSQRLGPPIRNAASATVSRVTQQHHPPAQRGPERTDPVPHPPHQQSGGRGPQQRPSRRNNLPEWATEDAEGRWEPPGEEEAQQQRSLPPPLPVPQQQQQRGPTTSATFYNRNMDSQQQQGQSQRGQAPRYSSMRTAGADNSSAMSNNQQQQQQQQQQSPRHSQQQQQQQPKRYNRYESPDDEFDDADDDDDYDSQGESDWHQPQHQQQPQKTTPGRSQATKTSPSQRRASDTSDQSTPSQQQQQQQPADATAIAAATIQQLLTNPALLQQLLLAATSTVAATVPPPTSSASAVSLAPAPAPQPQMYPQSPPQQQHQQQAQLNQSQTATSVAQTQQQHVQANVYRAAVPGYFWPTAAPTASQQSVPAQPSQPQSQSANINDFLNSMTPQQAAALQATAMSMFAGGSAGASAMPPYMTAPQPAPHPAPPTGAYFLPPPVQVGPESASSSAGPIGHYATPPQHSLRHAQPHHH